MRPTFAVLLSHWRRHPIGLAALLVGLALATALWSGVQALNAEARASYDRAAALLGGGATASVEAAGGGTLPLADYLALRRAGWRVSPLIEGDLPVGGTAVRVIGIEPVTLPTAALPGRGRGGDRLQAFMLPPHLALAAPETIARLAPAAALPPLDPAPDLPPDTVVVDIGVAEQLLGLHGRITRMLLPAEQAATPLPAGLSARLSVVPPDRRPEIDRLSASFHLNLTAFGLLSFVVGLFIVHAAAGLGFEQRRASFRTLRACGVSARGLAAALAVETLVLALAGGLAGILLGYLIAAALLPDVAASLRGLYGARVPGTLDLRPAWWLAGLAMSLGGALAATGSSLWRAATLPVLAPAQPEAWHAAGRRTRRLQRAAAAGLWAAALAALLLGSSLAAGFAVLAGLLIGAALVLPSLLAGLLALGARTARGPTAEWLWADARQGLGGLSLALMALLLALAVNIGVGTMVDSFRHTFLGYLDQRLAAEVYVTGRDEAESRAIADWLATRPEVTAVLPIRVARSTLGGWPLEVYGFRDHPTYRDHWPLLASTPGAWDAAARGEAALVSEQMARRQRLAPGDSLTLATPAGPWTLRVAAIYPDYGNAESQLMADADAVAARWPDLDSRRMAVRTDPAAAPALIAGLRARFGLDREVVDQRGLKDLSRRIFERTFAVTVALNALTLIVAGVAMLTSLLGLADARLGQLAPVWAAGLTRRRLAALEMARTLGLAALTALAALPLGLALAWVLTAVVNTRAFGWRLPVLLLPGQWATTLAVALATAALAALWPALRLRRLPPLALLQRFSNER